MDIIKTCFYIIIGWMALLVNRLNFLLGGFLYSCGILLHHFILCVIRLKKHFMNYAMVFEVFDLCQHVYNQNSLTNISISTVQISLYNFINNVMLHKRLFHRKSDKCLRQTVANLFHSFPGDTLGYIYDPGRWFVELYLYKV